MKQVIFCVETNKNANSDPLYIYKTVKCFYKIDDCVKLDYVYLDGKGNYNKPHILKEISDLCNRASHMKHYVIYCIDTDDLEDPDRQKETKKIQRFCKKRQYEFVWFCRDVEEVFLHKRVRKNKKVSEAKKFSNMQGLGQASSTYLHSSTYGQYKSNLLTILDNILTKNKKA